MLSDPKSPLVKRTPKITGRAISSQSQGTMSNSPKCPSASVSFLVCILSEDLKQEQTETENVHNPSNVAKFPCSRPAHIRPVGA